MSEGSLIAGSRGELQPSLDRKTSNAVHLPSEHHSGQWEAVVLPLLTGAGGAQAGTSSRKLGDRSPIQANIAIRNRH
jgi:hypothetical protein